TRPTPTTPVPDTTPFRSMHRAHVDDRAALAAPLHVAQAFAGGEERAVEVDGEHPLPVGEAEVGELVDDLDAGVRHQHVDLAPARSEEHTSELQSREKLVC